MKSSKILIGNDIPEQGILWANTLKSAGAFAVTRKANGMTLLQYVKDFSMPDVMIIEAKMAGLDAIGLIKEIKKLGELPIVIITAEYEMTSVREEAMYLGASGFLVKPFDVNRLIKCISEAGKRNEEVNLNFESAFKETSEQQDLECVVTDIIHQIGIPAHIKGYHFLRYAIMLSVENTEMINCVTKLLYPSVAAKFNTTSSRVERAIRHAIELAWDRGDVDVLNSYFGYTIRNTKGKPTNSEFIALISDKLRLQMKTAGYMVKL
ncbi:MAG: sporulation transcription factor Spo0A [Ruminococcaceae bacterium]|nr:sporulation transcription factor Spo0A [Oscillospiraceae bacterium]